MSSLGGGCCYNHFHLILGGVRQRCTMETQAYISLFFLCLTSDGAWWKIGKGNGSKCQDPLKDPTPPAPQYCSFKLLKYLFPIVHCGPTGSIIFLCSSFKLSPGRPRTPESSQVYKIMVYSSTADPGAWRHYFSSSAAFCFLNNTTYIRFYDTQHSMEGAAFQDKLYTIGAFWQFTLRD